MNEPTSQSEPNKIVQQIMQLFQCARDVSGRLKSLFDIPKEKGVCLQCHSQIPPHFDVCNETCEMEYIEEFKRVYKSQSGKSRS